MVCVFGDEVKPPEGFIPFDDSFPSSHRNPDFAYKLRDGKFIG